jgi:hypothetical protein
MPPLLSGLRPQGATAIIDSSWQLYRAHFTVMLTIVAITQVPFIALTAMVPALESVSTVMSSFALLAANCALTAAAASALRGAAPTLGSAFDDIRGTFGSAFALQIVTTLMVLLGSIFLLVPGIVAMVWTAVALQVMLIERVPLTAALSRSRSLARGLAGHVLRTASLVWIIFFALAIASGIAVTSLVDMVLSEGIAAMFGELLVVLLYPMASIPFALLYFDLRIRREGAEIEALLDAPPLPVSPGATPEPAV